MMAVDLHTAGDSCTVLLPSQFPLHDDDKDDDVSSDSDKNNNNHGSPLKPPQLVQRDDDFIKDLAHHMAHFTLQDYDDTFDFSDIASSKTQNFESSWDLRGSPQSTLWSPMGYNQGSLEGSSQEPSPPATPGDDQDSCWNSTTYDMVGVFGNMKLNETGNSKNHPGYEIQNSNSSNFGLCSHQTLIQEQIRAIELCRLKQEKVLSPKQNSVVPRQKIEGQISKQYESKEEIQKIHKKVKGSGGFGNGWRSRPPPPPRPAPLQTNSGMRAVFLGGSDSRGGTGVFLPRGTPSSSKSTNKQGLGKPQLNSMIRTVFVSCDQPNKEFGPRKGCSTVLIPARVAQVLQQHFDKTAAMSGPKVVGFPPLRDLASDRDGMHSIQNRRSAQAPADVQNEMILPREWTY